MKTLEEVSWFYRLYEDNDKIYLNVVCGTIGIFETIIELSSDEIRQFKNDKGFIAKLAKQINYNPDLFNDRNINKKTT